ncbi:hypothetical protein SLS60_000255 [Paraconiothyrium brasiliense]|uniref:Protein kinase domain-containing protein n=1 Tax=Paraconiothyrium brasiliense TaxID=300254 RepID=A0ABR3S5S4_9PLEO
MATVAQNETDPVNRSFTGILEEGNFYDREDDACHIKNGDPVPYRIERPDTEPQKPLGKGARAKVVKMLGVAEGIEWLTERIDDRGKYQGRITIFHNDLKPANILVCEDLLHTGSRAIFKISDFGEAIVRIMDSGNPPAKDEISPAEFSAPEVSFDHQNLTPSSDVWSFACILFLVLSFNIIGQWTLKGSADERRAENPLAQFFSGGSRRGLKNFLSNKKLKVNQHVESSMKRLEATGKNKSDARVTLGLVAMLRERLFVINPEDRLPISKVVNEMRQVYGSRRFITPEITDRKFRIGDSVDTCAQSPDGRDPELRILPKSMYGEQEKNGLSLSLKDCEVMKIAMSPDANHLAVVAKLARGKTVLRVYDIQDIEAQNEKQKELKAESVERYYQFLTCLAPLNERIGFIAIHSEERVLRYDPEKRYESDVEDWRQKGLKTVLITDDDKWVIFVGVYNKRLTVSAANLDSTIVSCKKLQIEDAAAIGFEPPADKVCIFENDQGERHLLFTYSGKMCRSVRLNIESLLEER